VCRIQLLFGTFLYIFPSLDNVNINDEINLLSIKYKKTSDKVDLPMKNTPQPRQEKVARHDHNFIWKYHENLHDCQLHA